MARKLIPLLYPDRASGVNLGVTPAAADPTYGMITPNDGRMALILQNTDGANPRTVSFDVPDVLGDTEDGLNIQPPDRTVALAISGTTGARKIVGPFPPQWSRNATHLTNGSLDAWASGTDVTGWAETITAGTIAREQVKVAGPGGSAAKLTRTSGTGALHLQQTFIHLLASTAYRLRLAWAADVEDLDRHCGVKVFNSAGTNRLQPDGTWLAGDVYAARWTPGLAYQEVELTFTTPGADDTYTLEVAHVTPGSLSVIYVDSLVLDRADGLTGLCYGADSALVTVAPIWMP